MRIDIPQELPRRRDDGDVIPRQSEQTVTRKLPDNPILHRLRSLDDSGTDSRRSRPRAKRPHDESAPEPPRDRRRPVPSADPRRPARTGGSRLISLLTCSLCERGRDKHCKSESDHAISRSGGPHSVWGTSLLFTRHSSLLHFRVQKTRKHQSAMDVHER
jgi:5-methylcytosine-specific restriction endonuclease McrA